MTDAEELEYLRLKAKASGMAPEAIASLAAQAPTTERGFGEALARGGAQGASLGFADEIAGGLHALATSPANAVDEALHPKEKGNSKSFGEEYSTARDAYRQADKEAQAQHGNAYLGGQLGGALASSFIPGLGVARGATLARALGTGALAGGINGLGSSTADDIGGMARDTAIGSAVGATAGGLGRALGRVGQAAGARADRIEAQVAAQAADKAAAETASARAYAGHAAQDAYRQLEHLRELKAVPNLTPEQGQVFDQLEQELAAKAQNKLLPAAAEKATKAEEYAQAMATEAQRAEEYAARKLSGGEFMRQVGARALRYGLPAAGGMVAHHMGLGASGIGAGALVGAGLRPMMHSLKRLAQQPVVQLNAARAAESMLGGLAEPAVERLASQESRVASPYLQALLDALRQPQPNPLASAEEPQP